MLRNGWADAREAAKAKAELEKKPDLADRIARLQFRGIRPKAKSEITDLSDTSVLLGTQKRESSSTFSVASRPSPGLQTGKYRNSYPKISELRTFLTRKEKPRRR
jgi:hypothetical protein